jgi:hypothetical protein
MKTDYWLTICKVTGLGESDYHAVRFSNYAIDNGTITPEVEIEEPPSVLPHHNISGQKLLTHLYSLYETINSEQNTIAPNVLIAQWCMKQIHPYGIDELYRSAPDMQEFFAKIGAVRKEQSDSYDDSGRPVSRKAQESVPDKLESRLRAYEKEPGVWISGRQEFKAYSIPLRQYGTFTVDQFLADLREIYYAVNVYHAIKALEDGDLSQAAEIALDGKYSNGMEHLSKQLLNGSLKKSEAFDYFCSLCRTLKMELRYDCRWKEFVYAPVLTSVFDIAWFALFRLAVSGADKAAAEKSNVRTIQCRACGRTVVATNNRQKYCNDAECQDFRQMKNKRAFDRRMGKNCK